MPLQTYLKFDSRHGLVAPSVGLVHSASLDRRLRRRYKGEKTRRNAEEKLAGLLDSVVANALVAHLKGKCVSYPRSNAHRPTRDEEEGEAVPLVDARPLCLCVDSLAEDGYLENTKAPRNSAAVHHSTYTATDKLLRAYRTSGGDLSLFLTYEKESHRYVKLKDYGDTRRTLLYGDTEETRRLEILGHAWANSNASYRVTHPDEVVLGYEWYSSQFVFKGDWCYLGRLFHPLSRWPAEVRRDLKVDGEATIEYDFKALHLNLLYAIGPGHLPKRDVYSIDAYPFNVDKTMGRKLAKMVANVGAINSNDVRQAVRALNGKIAGYPGHPSEERDLRDWVKANHISLGEETLIRPFVEYHKPVEEFFFRGNGLLLQRIEALILEKVLSVFVSKRLWICPFHDSFRVKECHGALLIRTMRQAFEEVLGVPLSPLFITEKK